MVICLTETHWDDELEVIFRRMAEKDFWIFCKHRPRAKENDDGSGGMAFLIRKDGDWDDAPVPIEGVAEKDGVMWISIFWRVERYNMGGFYVPPITSVYAGENEGVWESLVEDVTTKLPIGVTMVLGDFNGRIGDRAIFVGGNFYERDNRDKLTNKQGRLMIGYWEAAGLVPLSGLVWRETGWDEKGRRCARVRKLASNFTYVFEGKKRKGASNIDHIGLNHRELYRVESFEIRDDIWDVCNTAHRSVIATLKAQGERVHGIRGRDGGR